MDRQKIEQQKRTQLDAWDKEYRKLVIHHMKKTYGVKDEYIDDLAQEVFKRAWKSLQDRPETESIQYPKPWLLKIADNVCKRELPRIRQTNGQVYLGLLASSEEQSSPLHCLADDERNHPERRAEEQELVAVLYEGVTALPAETQHAVRQHYLEGKTYKEIAHASGKAASTVGRDVRKGVQQLQQWFQANENYLADNERKRS